MTKATYQLAFAVIYVIDLTDDSDKGFTWLSRYNMETKKFGDTVVLEILVGTKSDLLADRKIKDQDLLKVAAELNMKYFEVSSKSGANVDSLVSFLVEKCKSQKFDQPVEKLTIAKQPTWYEWFQNIVK